MAAAAGDEQMEQPEDAGNVGPSALADSASSNNNNETLRSSPGSASPVPTAPAEGSPEINNNRRPRRQHRRPRVAPTGTLDASDPQVCVGLQESSTRALPRVYEGHSVSDGTER